MTVEFVLKVLSDWRERETSAMLRYAESGKTDKLSYMAGRLYAYRDLTATIEGHQEREAENVADKPRG